MKFKKNNKILFTLIGFITILLCGCNDIALFHPKGQIAIEEKYLILTALLLMLSIVIPTIIITIFFSIKYRASNIKNLYDPNFIQSNKIEIITWFIPILIISFLSILTWKSTHKLDPKKPIVSNVPPIVIEVVSLNWNWLFIYPKYKIATINKIVFPKQVPIKFIVTSDTVMNSFFIPQLGSQIYAMAGMQSTLHLIANKDGLYKGISSNFSGLGFSGMKFSVFVTKNYLEFNRWIKKVQSSPKELRTFSEYEKLTISNKHHFIEYFSNVDIFLFKNIVKKFETNKK